MRLRPLLMLGLLGSPLAGAMPVGAIPGLLVERYATIPVEGTPFGLAFDRTGGASAGQALYVSRGTGALSRVPAGQGASTPFGSDLRNAAGVLVVPATISGTDGPAVLVAVAGPGEGDGQILAIPLNALPGAEPETLVASGGGLSEPGSMVAWRQRELLVADAGSSAILVYRANSTEPLVELIADLPAAPRFLVADRPWIYVSLDDGSIRRYAEVNGEWVFDESPGAGEAPPIALDSSQDGKLFALRLAGDGTSDLVAVSFPVGTDDEDPRERVLARGLPETAGEMELAQDGALIVAARASGAAERELKRIHILPGFSCGKAKPGEDAEAAERVELTLSSDQWFPGWFREDVDALVMKPAALCGPVRQGRAAIPAGPATTAVQLTSYRIKSKQKLEPTGPVCVQNLHHEALRLDPAPKKAPDRLLVASWLVGSSTTEDPLTYDVDTFTCHKAKLPKDEEPVKFAVRGLDVRSPKHLCVPVDVESGDDEIEFPPMQRPDDLLVCYGVSDKSTSSVPPRSGVHVGNELGADQVLDLVSRPRRARGGSGGGSGTLRGDLNETCEGEGTARPGVWDDLDGNPTWAGGGELGDNDWLCSSFSEAASFPEGEVERWRVFVEIDVTQNETGESPGVAMFSTGIPGIEDGLMLRPKAPGTPRGLRVASDWFTPPEGTTLDALAGASQAFDPRGDNSEEPFAFELKDWGVEYRLSGSAGESEAGPVDLEYCLPSWRCE